MTLTIPLLGVFKRQVEEMPRTSSMELGVKARKPFSSGMMMWLVMDAEDLVISTKII